MNTTSISLDDVVARCEELSGRSLDDARLFLAAVLVETINWRVLASEEVTGLESLFNVSGQVDLRDWEPAT